MVSLHPPIPILRSFDEMIAKKFYVDYLGFKVDWEHRFEPKHPLYMQISMGRCILHISEHHGDSCPGSALRIETSDIDTLFFELHSKEDPLKPGIEKRPWGRDMSVIDPFGNRLIFSSLNTNS